MIKRFTMVVAAVLFMGHTFAQDKTVKEVTRLVKKSDVEAHLTFLASDNLRGRGTGSPEIAIAADYIATQFKLWGVKPAPGSSGYFQDVHLIENQKPKSLDLTIGNDGYKFMQDVVLLKGTTTNISGDVVYVGFGQRADFDLVDVKGKLVVSQAGSSATSTVNEAFLETSPAKFALAKERGAAALIEVVNFPSVPWERLSGFLSGPKITIETGGETTPHLWLKYSSNESQSSFARKDVLKGSLSIQVPAPKIVAGKNVVGWVEGTDAKLKNEFIILSAHYDHLGVRKNQSEDSIYNGARDNGIGTTAILEAAYTLSQMPTKRSVLVLALCGEEKGLLGSNWYANHPLVALEHTVFDLDCDGAGYNNKEIASLIDLNRTNADDLLIQGCKAFGLTLKGDPAPEENLYTRSDNYNFAVKGIPAVDMGPGVNGLDQEIRTYYHQPADEVQTLDFIYLEKFTRAYVYSAMLLGNTSLRLFWKPGDPFEATGKQLYGIK